MQVPSSQSAKLLAWTSLFSICFALLIFSSPTAVKPVHANELAVLCIAEVLTFPDGMIDDPCEDAKLVTSNVMSIRSTADLPADLSPFEIIILHKNSGILLGQLRRE